MAAGPGKCVVRKTLRRRVARQIPLASPALTAEAQVIDVRDSLRSLSGLSPTGGKKGKVVATDLISEEHSLHEYV